jgi:HPr kinase/phosphorylase
MKDLFEDSGDRLGIGQMTGKSGLMREINRVKVQRYIEREGFWNRLLPEAIFIITPACLSELAGAPAKKREDILQNIISSHIPCLAIAETGSPPDFLVYFSEVNNIPLFTSVYDEFLLESRLIALLREKINHIVLIHGVFINVYGSGIIITGDSGIGKTACGLKLVERGHIWIADDVVEVEKENENVLYGRGHCLTRHLIEMKGVGVVRAKEFLGAEAVSNETAIKIMVEFEKASSNSETEIGRATRKNIMGVQLPFIKIPVFSNGALMARDVESVVGNFT